MLKRLAFSAGGNNEMEPESPRENLLIEHPSMFVKPQQVKASKQKAKSEEPPAKASNQATVKHQHRP